MAIMTQSLDPGSCVAGDDELLPVSPFQSLNYHFGMLLGVDDFETAQAYARGKMRLHNAWLHGQGVVWGFDVSLEEERSEIKVTRGLALDIAGHELHLDAEACVNIGEWFGKHKNDAGFELEQQGNTVRFDAHVAVRFKACLTRQVPALVEPCEGATTGTAYSRVYETVELLLLPGRAPARKFPYHLCRLLFQLDDAHTENGSVVPADQKVLDAVSSISGLPDADKPRALLEALRRAAANDVTGMLPWQNDDTEEWSLFPGADDEPVTLAGLTEVTLESRGNNQWALTSGTVDTTVRPSHIATSTIQELLCGPACSCHPETEEELPDNGGDGETEHGPQVDRESVQLEDNALIHFTVDQPLQEASIRPDAFSVTQFDVSDGWTGVDIDSANYEPSDRRVQILLRNAGRTALLRFIARGTGERPLLGESGLMPLAGAIGDTGGTRHDGRDFVHMFERRPA